MALEIQSTTKLSAGGRVVIPAPMRRALGLQEGDDVVLRLQGGELRLLSRKQALNWTRSYLKKLRGRGKSLTQELIEDRRKEAKGE